MLRSCDLLLPIRTEQACARFPAEHGLRHFLLSFDWFISLFACLDWLEMITVFFFVLPRSGLTQIQRICVHIKIVSIHLSREKMLWLPRRGNGSEGQN